MLTLDLNRLKVFHAVFAHRNLVTAAKSLHITRSAVSQNLKALELELQTKLFLRDSKKVLPTPPATELFGAMEPLLAGVQAVVQKIETGKTEAVGLLRIGAPQEFGSVHLTELLVAFRRKYPKVTFELTLAVPVTLLEMVSAGKLDLAFVDNGDLHARGYPVSVLTVKREKFVLACGKKYFAERVKQLHPRWSELKKLEYVDYLPHGPVAKIWLKHHFGRQTPSLKVAFCAESARAVVRATIGNFGLGVIPADLAVAEIKSGKLKVLFPGGKELVNQITLTRRLDRTPSAREELFVSFYRGEMGDLNAPRARPRPR